MHEALVSRAVFGQGMGNVIISRVLPDGRIAAGVFLIDAYCLGAKNAFLVIRPQSEYDEMIRRMSECQAFEPVAPAYARKLVEDAIAYADNLGFEPHRDVDDASVVLGDIDAAECSEVFAFGKDGRPCYASGPNDNEERVRHVLAVLRAHCGDDGFDYLIGVSNPEQPVRLGLSGSRVIRLDGTEIAPDGAGFE